MVQPGGQHVRSGTGQPAGADQRGCSAECGEAEDCVINTLSGVGEYKISSRLWVSFLSSYTKVEPGYKPSPIAETIIGYTARFVKYILHIKLLASTLYPTSLRILATFKDSFSKSKYFS